MGVMRTAGCYSRDYFSAIGGLSRASAAVLAPMVMELLQPQTVVDVGCGTGAWTAAFKAAGTVEVLGIDGEYCDRSQLEIDPSEFLAADITTPIRLDRRFDLAVCLEVAEHLDEQYAATLITSLTRLAPTVLFSAAIPFQGGEHHVNEQWPSYWVNRFAQHGFVAADPFRRKLWKHESVAWWYAQNTLLFICRERIEASSQLRNLELVTERDVLQLVHPQNMFNLTWRNRVLEAIVELITIVPKDAHILLVDDSLFGELPRMGCVVERFDQRGGVYGGPPQDSSTALAELKAKVAAGADTLAFGWPAFWWLDHYDEFTAYLRRHFQEIIHNERWVVFRLT
jgi:SAM-dependent methyltransferase